MSKGGIYQYAWQELTIKANLDKTQINVLNIFFVVAKGGTLFPGCSQNQVEMLVLTYRPMQPGIDVSEASLLPG